MASSKYLVSSTLPDGADTHVVTGQLKMSQYDGVNMCSMPVASSLPAQTNSHPDEHTAAPFGMYPSEVNATLFAAKGSPVMLATFNSANRLVGLHAANVPESKTTTTILPEGFPGTGTVFFADANGVVDVKGLQINQADLGDTSHVGLSLETAKQLDGLTPDKKGRLLVPADSALSSFVAANIPHAKIKEVQSEDSTGATMHRISAVSVEDIKQCVGSEMNKTVPPSVVFIGSHLQGGVGQYTMKPMQASMDAGTHEHTVVPISAVPTHVVLDRATGAVVRRHHRGTGKYYRAHEEIAPPAADSDSDDSEDDAAADKDKSDSSSSDSEEEEEKPKKKSKKGGRK